MDTRHCTEMDTVLKEHRKRILELEQTLDSIDRQLYQIKGCVYGVVGYAIATQLGFMELLTVVK
jgi:hypothetical protein